MSSRETNEEKRRRINKEVQAMLTKLDSPQERARIEAITRHEIEAAVRQDIRILARSKAISHRRVVYR